MKANVKRVWFVIPVSKIVEIIVIIITNAFLDAVIKLHKNVLEISNCVISLVQKILIVVGTSRQYQIMHPKFLVAVMVTALHSKFVKL